MIRRGLFVMLAWLALSGCIPVAEQFALPTDPSGHFESYVAAKPADAVPTVTTYQVKDQDGNAIGGAICYVPRQFALVQTANGPMSWRRRGIASFEVEGILTAEVSDNDMNQLKASFPAAARPVLLPCDLKILSIGVLGEEWTALSTTITAGQTPDGRLLWLIRIRGNRNSEAALDHLLGSNTGVLLQASFALTGQGGAVLTAPVIFMARN